MALRLRSRRLGPRGVRGVVASGAATAAALLLATGCAPGPVEIEEPALSSTAAQACRRLVDDLPDSLAGQHRREVSSADALGAAWGDPPIVLRCGVEQPADFTDSSTCIEVNDVGWFVPDDVLLDEDESRDVTMTAVGYRPRVEVVLPGRYRPEGFAAAAATLATVVDRDLEQVARCH